MAEKKAAAKKSVASQDSGQATKTLSTKSDVTKVAEECLAGRKWNTGRDRDELLKAAGYDPEEVRQEIYRIRGERLANS